MLVAAFFPWDVGAPMGYKDTKFIIRRWAASSLVIFVQCDRPNDYSGDGRNPKRMRGDGGYNPDSMLKKTLSASKEAFSLEKRDVTILLVYPMKR